MSNASLHTELKIALTVLDSNISAFARNLTKPDGSRGVSHTAVIRVAQGLDDTGWIQQEIRKVIAKARKEHPEFYPKAKSSKTAAG